MAILMPALASGQEAVDRRDLERCAALESSTEKLACFERLARGPARAVDAQADATVPAAGNTAPDAAAGSSPASVAGATAEPGPLLVADPAPASPIPNENSGSAIPPTTRKRSAASDAEAALPEAGPDLGKEQVEDKKPEERPELVSATVAEVWKGGNRMLYFQLTNGQIWRQMESDYFYYPKDREFDVTIRQGMMGDYQMRLDGRARMTRIIRVK